MNLIDEIKQFADKNGKISLEKLNDLKDKIPADVLNNLTDIANQNDDGKIDLNDLKDLKLDSLLDEAKSALGGLFGGKK